MSGSRERSDAPDEVARVLAEAVEARSDDEAAHKAFLEYCARNNLLEFAAQTYATRTSKKPPAWEAMLDAARAERKTSPVAAYRVSIIMVSMLVMLTLLMLVIPLCMRVPKR